MKVSIIVPVYNSERYINRCVDSLIGQTLSDIEILLVDDGSSDNSSAICDEYAVKDNRIKVFHQKNAGAGAARNTGLEHAQGEYIGFVDSDDYVDINMYETLFCAAEKHNADFVTSGMKIIGGKVFSAENRRQLCYCFEREELFEEKEGIKKLLLGTVGAPIGVYEDSRYGISACKSLYSGKIIEECNIRFVSEREFVSEDLLFLIDYIKHIKKAVGIAGAYYNYCRNDGSSSKSRCGYRFEKSLILHNEICKKLSECMEPSEYQFYTDRFLLAYARSISAQEILYAQDSRMPVKELKTNLLAICGSGKVAEALRRFPYRKLPVMQALFAFCMRYRLVFFERILVNLRKMI